MRKGILGVIVGVGFLCAQTGYAGEKIRQANDLHLTKAESTEAESPQDMKDNKSHHKKHHGSKHHNKHHNKHHHKHYSEHPSKHHYGKPYESNHSRRRMEDEGRTSYEEHNTTGSRKVNYNPGSGHSDVNRADQHMEEYINDTGQEHR